MSDNMGTDPQIILCDMCAEEDRKPARKTCMKCEISMCTQHLQVHLTTPVLLQTHPLTEPMALCGSTKCPQHGKLLEYYCLDDMTCVCVSCAIEDQHRLHNMKTFSTAHKELMEKLRGEQQALQGKSDDENVSLEKWEKSGREKLGSCSVRLIEAVTNLRDISLSSVQSSVSARMVSIKSSKISMQAAQDEKDTFRFLQMYSQVHQDVEKAKAVDLRKGLEPGSHRDKLVKEIREGGEKMMEQASHFWGSLLTLVDPENHKEFCATSSLLTFDPQNLGPGMSLSQDKRKVFYHNWMGKHSRHMLRFQSTHTFPNFNNWVIGLSDDCDWTIGYCDKSYAKEMKDGDVCGLRCKGRQLFSLTTACEEETNTSRPLKLSRNQKNEHPTEEKKRVVSLQEISLPDEHLAKGMTRPRKVEVVWKVGASLSFFSRIGQHQRVKILTLMLTSVNWDLAPFVCFDEDESQKSCTVSPRSFGAVSQPHSQKQWGCSCGVFYTETSDGYHYGGSIYQKSSQAKCSCGRLIGSPPTTEVLCELV